MPTDTGPPQGRTVVQRGSRDTDPQGHAHTCTGYTGRRSYSGHAHHQPPTICVRVHVGEPHSLLPRLCEEACTGANTQAQLYLQVLRGQHLGSKTHTRAETTGSSADWWTPVCSHVRLLKLGSTHTHARTQSPTSTPTCTVTHTETRGSRHACVTSTYSPVCLCSLWGLCAWHRGRHSGKVCRSDGHPEFQRGTSR